MPWGEYISIFYLFMNWYAAPFGVMGCITDFLDIMLEKKNLVMLKKKKSLAGLRKKAQVFTLGIGLLAEQNILS